MEEGWISGGKEEGEEVTGRLGDWETERLGDWETGRWGWVLIPITDYRLLIK